MGLLDKLRAEFIDIVEWTEPSNNDILCYRFPRYQNEIKNGAKLTVREGQAAVFVSEGQVADVFQPGMYTLETKNLPILGTIKGWKYGFNSPFKAEVYFVSTRQWTDKKWGTQNPVMMRDPEFGPVRVRAFGTYAFKVSDPATFLRQLVATDPSFETYEIANQLRNVIVSRIVDAMGQSKIRSSTWPGTTRNSARSPGAGRPGTHRWADGHSSSSRTSPTAGSRGDTRQRSSMAVLGTWTSTVPDGECDPDAPTTRAGGRGGAGLGAGIAIGRAMADAMREPVHSGRRRSRPVQFFVGLKASGRTIRPDLLAAKVQAGEVTRRRSSGGPGWPGGPRPRVAELQPLSRPFRHRSRPGNREP